KRNTIISETLRKHLKSLKDREAQILGDENALTVVNG
ncbi:MAG: hypothetical protein ACJAR6_001562, partial [Oleispira sp.]